MKVHEIVGGRLYQRGEFNGFDAAAKLAELRRLDVRYVVNLVSTVDLDLVGHVTYFHRPIPDGQHLDPGALLGLARGLAMLMRRNGGAALVHCHAGRNRSGLVNALIARELLAVPGAVALELVREKRPNAVANDAFARFLEGLPAPPPIPDRHMLYLIGQPGAGKSTLAAALTAGLPAANPTVPFAHSVWGSTPLVVELGARRDKFAGTDALGMSVQPKVVEWLGGAPYELVLGEGDRLANGKFFTAVVEAGWSLRIARLAVSSAVAAARRSARQADLGTAPQNPSWLKGRISKVARLADEWEPLVLELDADGPADRVLSDLLASGDPVAAVLASGVRV